MPRALFTAASGMVAQQLNIDNIAHNLANVNTTGFKRARLEFQDLLYQRMRIAGTGTSRDTEVPAGLQIGHGTRPVATERNFGSGPLQATETSTDFAVEGAGLFQVRLPSGELAYTRSGAFKIDSRGQIVTQDGFPMEPPVVLPTDVTDLAVGADGTITVLTANRTSNVQIGQIQLANLLNKGALEPMGRNLYRVTGDPGNVHVGSPGSDGFGTIAQGFLESSNVRVVEEMIALITGQRAYEASSKVIQTADRMLEDANRLR